MTWKWQETYDAVKTQKAVASQLKYAGEYHMDLDVSVINEPWPPIWPNRFLFILSMANDDTLDIHNRKIWFKKLNGTDRYYVWC